MSLKIVRTSLPDILLVEPIVYKDSRGFFGETYHYKKYEESDIPQKFVQDNHSHSTQGVLRGLHYQLRHPQAKLVYVVSGEIFDVAVDIRRDSPTYGHWVGQYLSGQNRCQMFIPEGFAHGFYVLSETADVIYKCTDFYSPGDEYGVLWSDPFININWPFNADPILSKKDSKFMTLDKIPQDLFPIYEG